MRPRQSLDAGFTLVELLVASAISLIITGVLATSIIVGLRNASASGQRLFNSHDAQIAQSYFTTDATSADVVAVASTVCPADAGDTLLVQFRWTVRPDSPTDALGHEVATYATRVADGERQLVRHFCSSTVSFVAAARDSSLVLAHGLDATVTPSVTCTFAAAPASEVSCLTATAANAFRTVRISAKSTQADNQSTDSLSYILRAARRSTQ